MTEPAAATTASNKSALIIVFIVILIDLLGFGIVLPLLPIYSDSLLAATDIPKSLHGACIGGIMAVFSLMQFLFAPVWGRVSDRVGRRPILLLGLAGSCVFYTLFGYGSSLGTENAQLALILIFVSRIGAGIAGATISTAQAVIADSTPPDKRKHGMALIGAAFGLGFTLGPIIAGLVLWLAEDRPELAGYAAAGFSFLALLYAFKKMPETRVSGKPAPHRGWIDVRGTLSTLRTPTVGLLVLIFFLATFGFAKFETTLGLISLDFGYTAKSLWVVFAFTGLILLLTQGYFYRKLAKKMDEVSLMRIGVVFMFLGLIAIAVVAYLQSMPMREAAFFGALSLGVFGFSFLTPSSQALISKRSDPTRQGEVLGVNQSFSALARILGPIAGSVLFKLDDSHMLPYLAGAALLGIVMLLLPKIRRV